ncbi:MAG: DUF1559 domain-containing protein [Pirellulales bacterium]
MSFRLWTIFYVFALVAAALAAFGAGGIVPAGVVLGFWAIVFYVPKPAATFGNVVLALFIFFVLIALLLPAVQSAREASRRNQCMSQLKQLALAIANYESGRKSFPPPFIAGSDGTPLLSWRVSIMPNIELTTLYDQIDRTKAWDDPVNLPLFSTPHDLMQCPSRLSTGASADYCAVVGPRTAWPESGRRRLSDFKDDLATTILLIESHSIGSNWAEPRNLTFDEAVELLTNPAAEGTGHRVDHGYFYKPSTGINVAFADVHVEFIRLPLPRELAVALLTIDGSEVVTPSIFAGAAGPELDYATCYVFGLFVVLTLLPTIWVRRRDSRQPRSGASA